MRSTFFESRLNDAAARHEASYHAMLLSSEPVTHADVLDIIQFPDVEVGVGRVKQTGLMLNLFPIRLKQLYSHLGHALPQLRLRAGRLPQQHEVNSGDVCIAVGVTHKQPIFDGAQVW